MPDKEMRTSFSHVLSLMSVNAVNIFAGGFHTWVVLDNIFPKKEEFHELKGVSSQHDSPLNSESMG